MSEIEQKISDIEDQFAELRGIDSVRAIHSLLVEAARFCDAKYGSGILSDIEKFGLSRDFDISKKSFAYRYIYNSLFINLYQEEDPPDSGRILQEELPLGISEILPMCGLSKEEVYEVFCRALENEGKNKLWDVYDNNFFVKREAKGGGPNPR
jgi:hypothetical protein